MAGINPATGQFDPYYNSGGSYFSGGNVTSTTNKKGVTTFTNQPAPAPAPVPVVTQQVDTGPSAAELAAQAAANSEKAYWDQQAQYAAQARQAAQNQLLAVTKAFFEKAGMGEFLAGMEKYIRAGYEGDSVMVMLANDPEYKAAWDKRFAGNVARRENGLAELLPADYVEMEQGYKSLMLKWGAPATLFDSNDDFAELIGRDVSVIEANDRLAEAAAYMNYEGNANVKAQLKDIYGMEDNEMFAYVLDPKRTLDYLQSESRRNLNRANVGGAALTQGVSITQSFRDEIAKMYESAQVGNSFGDANAKFGTVAKESPLYQRLGALSSETATEEELVRDQFAMAGGEGVDTKKKALASQERSRFSGQSGLGATSLSAGRRAQ